MITSIQPASELLDCGGATPLSLAGAWRGVRPADSKGQEQLTSMSFLRGRFSIDMIFADWYHPFGREISIKN